MRIGRKRAAALTAATVILTTGIGVNAMERSTINIPKGWSGLLTYGTLMKRATMERLLGRSFPGQVYYVHLKDYVRGWEFRRPLSGPHADPSADRKISTAYRGEQGEVPIEGLVSLSVYPQKGVRLNAALYLLPDEDLTKVDRAEQGYRRLDVTDGIEEYDFAGGRVYAYEGPPGDEATASADPAKYILVKESLDEVTRAADSVGKAFRAEFEKSTRPVTYMVVPFAMIIWEPANKE